LETDRLRKAIESQEVGKTLKKDVSGLIPQAIGGLFDKILDLEGNGLKRMIELRVSAAKGKQGLQ
jgi:hypothetical protein